MAQARDATNVINKAIQRFPFSRTDSKAPTTLAAICITYEKWTSGLQLENLVAAIEFTTLAAAQRQDLSSMASAVYIICRHP